MRVTLLALLLVGCTPPTRDSSSCEATCACAPSTLRIGTGPLPFEPMQDGQDVVMVHGPQGGWHVLAGLRATHVQPIVRIHYTIDALVSDPPARVSDTRYRVMLVSEETCSGDYPDLFGYLDVRGLSDGQQDTPPELLDGATLRLTMTVEDDVGNTASTVVDTHAVLDPLDAARR